MTGMSRSITGIEIFVPGDQPVQSLLVHPWPVQFACLDAVTGSAAATDWLVCPRQSILSLKTSRVPDRHSLSDEVARAAWVARGDLHLSLSFRPNAEPEATALAKLTFDPGIAAHDAGKVKHNRQPKTGSTGIAGSMSCLLDEGSFCGADSDAGVADRKLDHWCGIGFGDFAGRHLDRPLVGEFGRRC